jgi:hypothetical protein
MERYTIKFDDLTSIVDYSNEAENFTRDSFEVYKYTNEYLYIGHRKPFNSFYIHMNVASEIEQYLTVEYWNGSAYTPCPELRDSTKGMSRNGHVDFSREIDDWEKSDVDGESLYWVRVSGTQLYNNPEITTKVGNTTSRLEIEDADIDKLAIGSTIIFNTSLDGLQIVTIASKDSTTGAAYIEFTPATANPVDDNTDIFQPVEINGINVLFCDDQDLFDVVPYLEDNINYLPKGYDTYIPYIQAARKTIVQELRNKGKAKYNNTDYNESKLYWSNLTQFDILEREELREAAKYKVLELVFFNLKDEENDIYEIKSKDYRDDYAQAFSVAFLSLDKNDNGKVDDGENLTRQITRMRIL